MAERKNKMIKMTEALSDVSRTNQIEIEQAPEEVAEKLFQYLFKMGKGIETFDMKGWFSKKETSQPGFYEKRHKIIKSEIQKRLAGHGEKPKYSDIQYFFSYAGGKNYVFFLSPNKNHSGWTQLFSDKWGTSNRERILNLIFKFHILSQDLPVETMNGFEELLLLHGMNLSKSKDALLVWGQNLLIRYNRHNVLTLRLSRKSRRFLPEDQYSTLDGDDMGDLLVYKKKNYYFERDRDARHPNSIYFMRFHKNDEDFDKFKKTQLYYYHNLMTKLEDFLSECGIAFKPLHFQTAHYLENPFIKNIESVESLEIINNTGTDLSESDKQFLRNFLKHQGVASLTFYNSGETVSTYEQVIVEGEDNPCWKITEMISWSDIELDKEKNYLVFNKFLEEKAGSKAYQKEDGLWYPSTSKEIKNKSKTDFYSQLKKRFNYLDKGAFFSTQGMNVSEFRAVGDVKSAWSVLNYTDKKIDRDILRMDTQAFTNGKFLEVDDSISCYLTGQTDSDQWEKFCDKHKIRISPEFQKVLIELGIKNWIRKSLVDPSVGLPVTPQSFSEKQFFTIYVRSPRNEETKAVAVEFVYKEGFVYVKDVMRDVKQIKKRFRFLRKNNSEKLIDNQQYFADESERLYISCYTTDLFTPTLIGRNSILEDMKNGTLKIDRKVKGENSSRLLPLVSYYNGELKPIKRIQNMICFDLQNETFIQYYVPPGKSLGGSIKKGFRVYHLIGYTYSKKQIPTSELIGHPITALHFSTLTQNVLKISDNSQSSLLQKVARVLIEN